MKLLDILLESLLEPSIVSYDKLKNIDGFQYDTTKPFWQQDFPNKSIESKSYKALTYHLICLTNDIRNWLNRRKDIKDIVVRRSMIKSGQTNRPSFSTYIQFKTDSGKRGQIRISDHRDMTNQENTYMMRFTTFFDKHIEEKISKYIDKIEGKTETFKKPVVQYSSGLIRKIPKIYKKNEKSA